jgi:outer membrane protein assembly factor BamA
MTTRSLTAAILLTALASAPIDAPQARAGPGSPVAPGEANGSQAPAPGARAPSKLGDPGDGWFDISAFIDESYGFVPLVIPVTEPAVGYGAVGALVFIDKQKGGGEAGYAQPNLTAVGGGATENGTWGLFGMDSRHWMDDRLQTVVGVVYANAHLDYYGLGEDSWLQEHPLAYQLTPVGGRAQVRYRLGGSRAKIGLAYTLATTRIESDPGDRARGLPPVKRDSRSGGLTPALSYDSRNNLFTPTRGVYAEAQFGVFGKALGGDANHQKAALLAMGFQPLHPRVTLGARGSATFSFGDAPFYTRPFVSMRGIAAMRYQGEQVAQAEAEIDYQFWKRFSVVGFGGVGSAWSGLGVKENRESVQAFGTGFRYEIARKYGLHMGLDMAWGPDEPAFYMQFGNAWGRL